MHIRGACVVCACLPEWEVLVTCQCVDTPDLIALKHVDQSAGSEGNEPGRYEPINGRNETGRDGMGWDGIIDQNIIMENKFHV